MNVKWLASILEFPKKKSEIFIEKQKNVWF